MPEFHDLSIKDVRRETKDTVSIAFDVPETLKNDFRYINGQYITLKKVLNGEEIRRSYSLSSCLDTDQEYRIAVKEVKDGKMSTWLNRNAKAGDVLEVMKPEGAFHPQFEAGAAKSYILFAAGSGITPVVSIAKGILKHEPDSTITLFYGNRTEEDIIFKEELDRLADQYAQFSYHNILTGGESKKSMNPFKKKDLFKGRMDQKKVIALLNAYADLSHENEYFICGPTGMMASVENALKTLRVDKQCIHIEYFTPPEEASNSEGSASQSGATASTATIVLDDEEHTLEIPAGTTVLDAALDEDIDAPYSCRGAVCSSCMAKLEEGSVDMKMNYVLTDAEVEEGYIVTCQSVPTSKTLKINYDV